MSTQTQEMGDYRTKPSYETFSFLPPLTREEILAEVSFLLAQGWNAGIEHEHPSKAMSHYWPMWKLPSFGLRDANAVMAEVEACRRAYPDHHIRLVAYDNYAQSLGTSFVVHRAA